TPPPRRGRRQEEAEEPFWKRPSPLSETREATRTVLDIELHLETPLPWEWQRYLDIQSGQIHFYNTRTHKKTLKDPRETLDADRPTSPCHHVSLDLELNLPYGHDQQDDHEDLFSRTTRDPGNLSEKESGRQVKEVRSWLGLETRNETKGGEEEQAEKEEEDPMVATVCARCHMLVMLCKSSPTCPNCKFLHPPDQSRRTLFKGRCSLLR
ncbi:WW domain-containing protein, partial [Psidium guajava]